MKYFKTASVTNTSFLYKGRRVVVKDGVVMTEDKAVIKALEASDSYKEIEAPSAPSAPASGVAAALAAGATPKKDSTEGTTKVGISTSGALDALKKNS